MEHEVSVSLLRRKDAPIVRQRWSTLAITAVGLLLAQPAAYAAGFGQLRVQSNLGQPLQAEIDITGVSAEEADSLAVKLIHRLQSSAVFAKTASYVSPVRVLHAQAIPEIIYCTIKWQYLDRSSSHLGRGPETTFPSSCNRFDQSS